MIKRLFILCTLLILSLIQTSYASPDISIGVAEKMIDFTIEAARVYWREDLEIMSIDLAAGELCTVRLVTPRDIAWSGDSASVGMWLERSLGFAFPVRLVDSGNSVYQLVALGKKALPLAVTKGNHYTAWKPGLGAQLLEIGIGGETIYTRDRSLWVQGGIARVTLNNLTYRGQVYVQPDRGQLMTAVNRISLEDYLLGVVPHEMPASWPLPALRAQTLAARSYAVRQMGRHQQDGFDLCSTVHCQAYGGTSLEHPRSSQAVTETKGEVIIHGGGIIDAVYHAHAGGHTLNSEYVWGGVVPYLKGVPIPEEPPMLWTRSIAFYDLERILRSRATFTRLQNVEIPVVGQAGHVLGVRANSLSGYTEFSASAIRSALGSTRMRSTKFQVQSLDRYQRPLEQAEHSLTNIAPFLFEVGKPAGLYNNLFPLQPTVVVFSGEGFGHGVGMSQWGAYGLANKGWSYVEIIQRFYTGVRVISNYGK